MTLTDYIFSFLQDHPNGATSVEIQQYCKDTGYVNKAQNEIKNISGICSHKCSRGKWFKLNMGRYYIWSLRPFN